VGKVISSRSIKKLVEGTTSITKTGTPLAETTGENGIVVELAMAPRQVSVAKKAKGYCIGSEYITD
jgi:hypothetical protein